MFKKSATRWVLWSALFVIFLAFIPLPFKPSIYYYTEARAIRAHINTFSSIVLIPDEVNEKDHASITSDKNWENAYQIRWESKKLNDFQKYSGQVGAYSTVLIYQLDESSRFTGDTSHVPGIEEMNVMKQTFLGFDKCEDFDPVTSIKFCKDEFNGYLVKETEFEGKKYYSGAQVYNGTNEGAKRDNVIKNDYNIVPVPVGSFKPSAGVIDAEVLKNLQIKENDSINKYIKPYLE
jgi:hypothetical protein